MDEAISGLFTGPIFLEHLKAAGATPDEVEDYISQFSQCRREHSATMVTSSEGAQPDPVKMNMPSPVNVTTLIAWVLL